MILWRILTVQTSVMQQHQQQLTAYSHYMGPFSVNPRESISASICKTLQSVVWHQQPQTYRNSIYFLLHHAHFEPRQTIFTTSLLLNASNWPHAIGWLARKKQFHISVCEWSFGRSWVAIPWSQLFCFYFTKLNLPFMFASAIDGSMNRVSRLCACTLGVFFLSGGCLREWHSLCLIVGWQQKVFTVVLNWIGHFIKCPCIAEWRCERKANEKNALQLPDFLYTANPNSNLWSDSGQLWISPLWDE